jgi:acetyl-CoA synthetase
VWEIVDALGVNIFYTAPTAIRALRQQGDTFVKQTSRKSLKLLGTVGEPISPDAWQWYYDVVGNKCCPIVDTWWQTETGGIMLSAFPAATPLKPGSAAWPYYGVVARVVDEKGEPVSENQMGKLVMTQPWPGLMQTVYGDRARFVKYFTEIPGCYLTGDEAHCDADGYFWINGRDDDVLKISGHRIGTGEVEGALGQVHEVAEAAVVGVPDPVRGEAIYAFVVLTAGVTPSQALAEKLIAAVRSGIGAIATLEYIQWATGLPKTRSGKIMRRVLRKIAQGDVKTLGDTSTLAEPEVVTALIKGRVIK